MKIVSSQSYFLIYSYLLLSNHKKSVIIIDCPCSVDWFTNTLPVSSLEVNKNYSNAS